jgi:hypothetical protein
LNSEYVNVSKNVFHCVGDSGTTGAKRQKTTKDTCPDKPEKSSVAEYSIGTGHGIDFCGTELLDTK